MKRQTIHMDDGTVFTAMDLRGTPKPVYSQELKEEADRMVADQTAALRKGLPHDPVGDRVLHTSMDSLLYWLWRSHVHSTEIGDLVDEALLATELGRPCVLLRNLEHPAKRHIWVADTVRSKLAEMEKAVADGDMVKLASLLPWDGLGLDKHGQVKVVGMDELGEHLRWGAGLGLWKTGDDNTRASVRSYCSMVIAALPLMTDAEIDGFAEREVASLGIPILPESVEALRRVLRSFRTRPLPEDRERQIAHNQAIPEGDLPHVVVRSGACIKAVGMMTPAVCAKFLLNSLGRNQPHVVRGYISDFGQFIEECGSDEDKAILAEAKSMA